MKKLLAIDTSSPWAGIALLEYGEAPTDVRVVAETGMRTRNHGAQLLLRIAWLMEQAGWSRDAPDAYVACRGPGSFTGLRIGLGTIRGLAVAGGTPCYGIGSLDAMAEALGPSPVRRLPLLIAGRGEVYAGLFAADGSPPVSLGDPEVGPAPEIVARSASGAPLVVFGPGTELLDGADLPPQVTTTEAPRNIAAAAGRLALRRSAGAERADAGMSPLYVRPPDATPARNAE